MVVKTAFLPVTLPLNVAASTTDLVINIAGGILHHAIQHRDDHSVEKNEHEYLTPAQDLLNNVINFIPFVMKKTMKKVTPAVAGTHAYGPKSSAVVTARNRNRKRPEEEKEAQPKTESNNNNNNSKTGTSDGRDDFLERLKLDIFPDEKQAALLQPRRDKVGEDVEDDDATTQTDTTETSSASAIANPCRATNADFSKFLLRVDDVNVLAPPNPATEKVLRVLYVDLGTEFGEENITKDALSQLIQRGIDVAFSNSDMEIIPVNSKQPRKVNASNDIDWKPEGLAKRELKKLAVLNQSEFFEALRTKVLIWSGKFKGPKYLGCDNPLFMARGVVNGSPRDFTMMLWDSTRTREYNNYCLGRKDVIVMNDELSNGGSHGAKVIKSETKVPFTSLSVFLSVVMHAKPLGDNPEDGYVIFSRSLDTGRAGYHVGKTNHVDQSNKNEIILGVNIMRPVPGRPDLTDLISVSQVNASMVPPFLTFKIGMMGVEDFFKNVRL
jgi:hypothetical protein